MLQRICSLYQFLVGVLEQLIDVVDGGYLLLHLDDQLLLRIPELFAFLFQLFSSLLQSTPESEVIFHQCKKLLQGDIIDGKLVRGYFLGLDKAFKAGGENHKHEAEPREQA